MVDVVVFTNNTKKGVMKMKIMTDIDTGVVSIIFESNEEKHQIYNIIEDMLDDNECMVFCYYPEDSVTEKEKEKIAKSMVKVEQFLMKQRGSINDILDEMVEEEGI